MYVYDTFHFAHTLTLQSHAQLVPAHTCKQVLMVSSRNYEGEWTIPGGGLEPHELAAEAAVRETHEEVCVCVCVCVRA